MSNQNSVVHRRPPRFLRRLLRHWSEEGRDSVLYESLSLVMAVMGANRSMDSRVVVDCILRFTGGGETLRSALRLVFVLITETGGDLRLMKALRDTRAAFFVRLMSMRIHESRERYVQLSR